MFAVFDNMQKMLYTESVEKHHKKESHMHDSSNSFITAIIMNWKYAFQFLREEMEPIRMLSNAAGIICNGEPQEQEGFYKGWKPGIQGINNNSDNVTTARLWYNLSKASAQTACSKSSKVKRRSST